MDGNAFVMLRELMSSQNSAGKFLHSLQAESKSLNLPVTCTEPITVVSRLCKCLQFMSWTQFESCASHQ